MGDEVCPLCGERLSYPVCYCPYYGYIHCSHCPIYNSHIPIEGECRECERLAEEMRVEEENTEEF